MWCSSKEKATSRVFCYRSLLICTIFCFQVIADPIIVVWLRMKTKNFESFNWKNNYIFVHVVQAKHVVLEAYFSEQGQKDFFKVNGWNVWSGYGGHWFLSYRPIIISIWGNTIKQQIYDLYYHVSTSTQVNSTACRESGHKRLHCLVLCSLFLGERRKSGQEQPAKWEKDSKRGGEKASSKGQWLTIGRRLGPWD